MGDMGQMAADYERALNTGDFREVGKVAQQYASDDFVTEWPQSGERLNTAAMMKMGEGYEQGSGTSPKFIYKRMLGGGDLFIVEGSVDYGDGVPVRYVGIGEVRDGKVAKMTEYFANPFPAPEWRAGFVERYEP